MLKLGIIACAHGNHKAVARLKKECEKNKADAIALCGDLGDNYSEILSVLKAAKTKKIIAFPGSHEPAKDYQKAVQKAKVIDGTKKRRITIKGYDVLILPGSSVNTATANYRIGDTKIPARYKQRFIIFPVKKLAKLIRHQEKTILLCHDPPKCTGKKAIDVAYSGIVSRNFVLKPKHFRIAGLNIRTKLIKAELALAQKGEIMPQPYAGKLAKLGYPIIVKHRNVGNNALKAFLKKYKINFFACGHIHEAGHRAVSSSGKPLKPGKWGKSVWYNSAPAVKGNGGILIIEGKKAMFKNIRVKS
jgi:Icc-related predicted phosphoesterase